MLPSHHVPTKACCSAAACVLAPKVATLAAVPTLLGLLFKVFPTHLHSVLQLLVREPWP